MTRPLLVLARELAGLDRGQRALLAEALERWLEAALAPLAPLRALEAGSEDPAAGSEVRALLLTLLEHGGAVPREAAGLAIIPKEKRPLLRSMGVTIGALDVFVPALLKPAPRRLLHAIGADRRALNRAMEPVISSGPGERRELPAGYRRAGRQAIRIDMAEKLIRAAHEQRMRANRQPFDVDPALATSMGLAPDAFVALMRDAGFRAGAQPALAEGVFGPPPPHGWSWRAPRKDRQPQHAGRRSPARGRDRVGRAPASGNAFAGLADLLG